MTREELRRRGEALAGEIFGGRDGATALANPALGFGPLMAEPVYGSVWTRPGLEARDRMARTLAALTALQAWPQLRRHAPAAVRLGLEPCAVLEVLIQTGIYRGFAAAETAVEAALEAFRAHGIAVPDLPERTDPLEALTARGREVQAALHGARKDLGHASPANPVTSTIYPLAVQYCYGEIWDRPGLDRRLRALVAVAAFAALDHEPLLAKFALSALNVGATRAEVTEAIVQIGPYAGFAFTLKGLNAASESFAANPEATAR
jgi:4-carboxymuconolactone decarboxylase